MPMRQFVIINRVVGSVYPIPVLSVLVWASNFETTEQCAGKVLFPVDARTLANASMQSTVSTGAVRRLMFLLR